MKGQRRIDALAENTLIREKYPTGNLSELAAQCKCSIGALCQRAARIGVYRTVVASRDPKPVSFGTHVNPQVTIVAPGHIIHKATM